MAVLDFTRQSTLVPSAIKDLTVSIVGVGSIGSHVAETLAKTGISTLVLYDHDTVEAHNLPNQGYYLPDIGKTKVQALKERLEAGTGVTIDGRAQLFEEGAFNTRIVVTGLDSMKARKAVWKAFMADPVAEVLIDGRMGSRFGKVLYVYKQEKETIGAYLETLHGDEDSMVEPCTARSTIFCAYGIAGLMCAALVNWVLGEPVPVMSTVDFVTPRVAPVVL